jgi:hypothetical protein
MSVVGNMHLVVAARYGRQELGLCFSKSLVTSQHGVTTKRVLFSTHRHVAYKTDLLTAGCVFVCLCVCVCV